MADKSAIEWTDATWNPVVGCSIVSPGCTNCYAMAMAHRIQAMAAGRSSGQGGHYLGTTRKVNGNAVWTGKVARAPDDVLLAPLKWKRPRKIFVNSMGDLFHESIPDTWIDRVFAVMALCPQHTFQVLTKRAERMREFMWRLHRAVVREQSRKAGGPELEGEDLVDAFPHFASSFAHPQFDRATWPLPNVWLGVSAERQQEADERIPLLLQTPAAIRFASLEPLLGPIDLTALDYYVMLKRARPNFERTENDPIVLYDVLRGHMKGPDDIGLPKLDWVIVGGESGAKARPMNPQWARSLRDQCVAANVPFFYKQTGEWQQRDCVNVARDHAIFERGGASIIGAIPVDVAVAALRTDVVMERVGKKAAGRLLDGKEWNEFPVAARPPHAATHDANVMGFAP